MNIDKNLLKFLDNIEELTIYYNYKDLTNDLQSIKYCNNNFTGNKKFFRSIYNYMFKFAGGPINWKSKRVIIVALSTLKTKTNIFIKDIREVS